MRSLATPARRDWREHIMTEHRPFPARTAAAAIALVALTCAAAPSSGWAQRVAHDLSRSEQVTGKVTVKAVDLATRHMTVTEANGESHTLKVGPEIKNLDKVKPGDKISVTYTVSAAF